MFELFCEIIQRLLAGHYLRKQSWPQMLHIVLNAPLWTKSSFEQIQYAYLMILLLTLNMYV